MGNMVIQKAEICTALSDKEVTTTRKTITPTNPKRGYISLICLLQVSMRCLTIDHDEMQVVQV